MWSEVSVRVRDFARFHVYLQKNLVELILHSCEPEDLLTSVSHCLSSVLKAVLLASYTDQNLSPGVRRFKIPPSLCLSLLLPPASLAVCIPQQIFLLNLPQQTFLGWISESRERTQSGTSPQKKAVSCCLGTSPKSSLAFLAWQRGWQHPVSHDEISVTTLVMEA